MLTHCCSRVSAPDSFLLTRSRFKEHLNALLKIHGLAFCFLGFWITPLLANLPWTTKFNILWIFFSWKQAMEEILPPTISAVHRLDGDCSHGRRGGVFS